MGQRTGAPAVLGTLVALNQLLAVAPALAGRPPHLVKRSVLTSLSQLAVAMTFPDFNALRNPATYGVAFTIAIVGVLLTDLLKGVSIGLVLGFFFILTDNAKVGSYLRRSETDPDPNDANSMLHLHLPEHVSFLRKANIVTTLKQLPSGSRSDIIDHDVLEAIEDFRQATPVRGIDLKLRGTARVAMARH